MRPCTVPPRRVVVDAGSSSPAIVGRHLGHARGWPEPERPRPVSATGASRMTQVCRESAGGGSKRTPSCAKIRGNGVPLAPSGSSASAARARHSPGRQQTMSDDPRLQIRTSIGILSKPRSTSDDVLVDDVGPDGLGRNQPFWKVLLWHTAEGAHRVFATIAPPVGASSLERRTDKPPRLAADEEPIPPHGLSAIEQKIEELLDPARQLRTDEASRAGPARPGRSDRGRVAARYDDDDDDMTAAPRRTTMTIQERWDGTFANSTSGPAQRADEDSTDYLRRLSRSVASTSLAASKWRRSTSPSCPTRRCRNFPT